MTELTAREGDGDAARTGYWIVTGPQPEDEAYATIERTRDYLDDGGTADGFSWYLHQRQGSERDRQASFMGTISRGSASTYDMAMTELHAAWDEHLGLGAAAEADETAEVTYPWLDR